MSKDGGPAFPWQWIDRDSLGKEVVRESHSGMSLRDYFAAHAPAMTERWFLDTGGASRHWIEAQAAFSYEYADKMLAERERK